MAFFNKMFKKTIGKSKDIDFDQEQHAEYGDPSKKDIKSNTQTGRHSNDTISGNNSGVKNLMNSNTYVNQETNVYSTKNVLGYPQQYDNKTENSMDTNIRNKDSIRTKSDDTLGDSVEEGLYSKGKNKEMVQDNDIEMESNDDSEFSLSKIKSCRVDLNDYTFYRTIGTGSFGRVKLVKKRNSDDYFAVKILRKSEVVRAKQVEHVNNERAVLAFCDSPFIVKIQGTSQDSINLYMIMEYVIGGELFSYLRKYRRFPSPVAKFYAAEVTLAFEYLHSFDLVYRDLKPENILVDTTGHIKLTDLGFSKHVPDVTWTLCGTPDYLAPEIIQAKGYGKSVDWYALGVLIFEMIAGYPPFYEKDHYRLYERILSGKIAWPVGFDLNAKNLVQNLISHDLTKRYGNLKGGARDIKSHVWFKEVNWDKLAKLEISAPLIPSKKSNSDTGNFDKYEETGEEYGNTTASDIFRMKFKEF
ncbi:hypothetical protein BB559_003919 [Furculomyces boomerangus]|uniref:cAMP-dependent protein kinase n=1 Tax=Furculomyces boomerangus TaxID=61424 RepID=A0A2T9YHZ7_9FUNG|nr:hypothetical protein BB559_003919 [Furculomyces boomerangus]